MPIKHVVIAGAGSIGLSTAYLLKKKGVESVTIVDSRANRYTRSGYLDGRIFRDFATDLEAKVEPSDSHHIKDLDRELYREAKNIGVRIIAKTFKTFKKDGIELIEKIIDAKNNSETITTETIPCDLILDCTGETRAVVHETNRLMADNPPFKFETIRNNPIKNHFLAYGKMTNENRRKLSLSTDFFSPQIGCKRSALQLELSPNARLQHTLALERLRTEFSWPEFDEPYFQFTLLNKNKVILYLETPPSLKKEQQEQWLQAVLSLKTGDNNMAFERVKETGKYGHKNVFSAFVVDAIKTNTAYFAGTMHNQTSQNNTAENKEDTAEQKQACIPPVVLFGDSHESPEYRLGKALNNGRIKAKEWVKTVVVKSGGIDSMDMKTFQETIKPTMREYESDLTDLYNQRNARLHDALEVEKARYTSSLAATSDPAEQKIITAGLEEIQYRQLQKIYRPALEKYKKILDEKGNLILTSDNTVKSHMDLIASRSDLITVYESLPPIKSIQDQAKATLLEMAANIKQIAGKLFERGKLYDSVRLYKLALQTYSRVFPEKNYPAQYKEEIVKLCSNLAMLSNKLKEYQEAKQYATMGLNLIATDQATEYQQLKIKLQHYKRACQTALKEINEKKAAPQRNTI